ncbi:MAG: DUF3467 domain-containing protein [Gammaproteobacteria bacterium]|nr:DUF3467 domain-containing protein [Gammaproteobacteria bacterium]
MAKKKTEQAPSAKPEQQPTDEDLKKQMSGAMPINAPYFNAGVLQVNVAGNDVLLIFHRARPVSLPSGEMAQAALTETVAIVSVSPQTAKDMSLLLPKVIQDYEAEFGEIVTPFTQKLGQHGRLKKDH